MEFLPVVEVVQIDRVGGFSVRETHGGKDGLARLIGVLVTGDRGIQLGHRGGVELRCVLGDEFFELHIGRLVFGNEGNQRVAVHAEGVEGHCIVAGAAVRVSVGELAGRTEAHFLPKAGNMKNSERACGSGRDGRNDFVTHDCGN